MDLLTNIVLTAHDHRTGWEWKHFTPMGDTVMAGPWCGHCVSLYIEQMEKPERWRQITDDEGRFCRICNRLVFAPPPPV